VGGRVFDDRDRAASAPVVIVNETFARRAFKQGPALGRRLRLPNDAPPWMQEGPREIVGVVADVPGEDLRSAPGPGLYIPEPQMADGVGQLLNRFLPLALVVKTRGEPLASAQAVRQIVLSVDPMQPVAEIRSMDQIVARSTSRDSFNLTLMSIFAFVALALAAIGIYGVISYSVAQRTQELGVRVALGASAPDLLRMVMKEGMLTSMAGVAVGLAGAWGLSRFLAQLLFSVKPADPATFAGVAVLMLAVAFLANLMPALRATRVDPLRALRYE
jgi:predicted permease